MTLRKLIVSLFIILFSTIFLFSCVYSRPPKPGPNFVWVAPVKGPGGKTLPGHWVYKGKSKPGKVWVKGHYGPRGKWIPGHWK